MRGLGREPCENPPDGSSEPWEGLRERKDPSHCSHPSHLILPVPPLAKPYWKPEGKETLEEEGRVKKDGSIETNKIYLASGE